MKKTICILLTFVMVLALCSCGQGRVEGRKIENFVKPGYIGNGAYADTRRNEFDIRNQSIYMAGIIPDVLFIGDSITHFWDTEAIFDEYGTIVNRGIGGDVAENMAQRFYADVVQLEPKVVVCMIGFNNTMPLKEFEDTTTEEYQKAETQAVTCVKNNHDYIIRTCKENNIKLIMCTVTPTIWPEQMNTAINKINENLKALCEENDIPLVNYHDALLGDDGIAVNMEYTVDGTHPNYQGYSIMKDLLTPELDKLLK